MTWSGWPSPSSVVRLDVAGATGRGLRSRVLEVDAEGLWVASPCAVAQGVDLAGRAVTVHWTDPYRGLCALPSAVLYAPAGDLRLPWHLAGAGPTQVVQRRRYVREAVKGRVTVVPRWGTPRVPTTGWIIDLSEGGVRALLPVSPGLRPGESAAVVLDMPDGEASTDAQALRVARTDRTGQYEVVLEFDDDARLGDRIRQAVFVEQRRRMGAVLPR